MQRSLFERLVNAARKIGLIAKDAAQLLDSGYVLGAAGARVTYTLIRGGIRKLLRSLRYSPASTVGLSDRLWWYIDPEAPEKPEVDWAEARAAHLKHIVRDGREALSLADRATNTPATNEAAAVLEKIVCDDVEDSSEA